MHTPLFLLLDNIYFLGSPWIEADWAVSAHYDLIDFLDNWSYQD